MRHNRKHGGQVVVCRWSPINQSESRRDQLDYQNAMERGLPVGSGLIESGHRHVLQARLKIPGAWWKPENAYALAQLRALRANDLWHTLWVN